MPEDKARIVFFVWGASVEAAIRNTLAAAYRWGAANVNSCCAVPTCAARTGGLPYAAEAAGRLFTERALPDVSGAALLLMVGAPYAYAAAFRRGRGPLLFRRRERMPCGRGPAIFLISSVQASVNTDSYTDGPHGRRSKQNS